jgi:hypothetical protein
LRSSNEDGQKKKSVVSSERIFSALFKPWKMSVIPGAQKLPEWSTDLALICQLLIGEVLTKCIFLPM